MIAPGFVVMRHGMFRRRSPVLMSSGQPRTPTIATMVESAKNVPNGECETGTTITLVGFTAPKNL
jgi:hypothetical protein